jgi:hypothetical protein
LKESPDAVEKRIIESGNRSLEKTIFKEQI